MNKANALELGIEMETAEALFLLSNEGIYKSSDDVRGPNGYTAMISLSILRQNGVYEDAIKILTKDSKHFTCSKVSAEDLDSASYLWLEWIPF